MRPSYPESSRPMFITLVCPNLGCRSLLRVSIKARGKQVCCPKCGGLFLVPRDQGTHKAPAAGPEVPAAQEAASPS